MMRTPMVESFTLWASASGGGGGEVQFPSGSLEAPTYTKIMNVKFSVTLSFTKDIRVILKCTVKITSSYKIARWSPSRTRKLY